MGGWGEIHAICMKITLACKTIIGTGLRLKGQFYFFLFAKMYMPFTFPVQVIYFILMKLGCSFIKQ